MDESNFTRLNFKVSDEQRKRSLRNYISSCINVLHAVLHNQNVSMEDINKALLQVHTALAESRRIALYLTNKGDKT